MQEGQAKHAAALGKALDAAKMVTSTRELAMAAKLMPAEQALQRTSQVRCGSTVVLEVCMLVLSQAKNFT